MANHRPPKPGLGVQVPPPPHMVEINKDPKFLRKKSKEVKKIDDETRELVLEMVKAMKEKKGIGLAACQIGYLKRIIVINKEEGFSSFINPIVSKKSKKKLKMEEGCLSLPDCFIELERPEEVKVKFLDLQGKEKASELKGVESRVFQHEVDHLNGILITDKKSLIQRIKNYFKK